MIRTLLVALVFISLAAPVLGQEPAPAPAAATALPRVTFGTQMFLQYMFDLEDEERFNEFDITRGYLDVRAQLTERVRARFTPDVRRFADADLTERLGFALEYAYLQVDMSPRSAVVFGLHPTPWLEFEQSINRYRVQGPMFSERMELIPGPSDLGASFRTGGDRTEVHVGVYNGEGRGESELDSRKSVQGRATFRPYGGDAALGGLRISGFYSYGWYAADRPRNVAIVMGSYEHPNVVATAQYMMATDNPFVAVDIERRGLSVFGEVRTGPTGWAGLVRADFIDPNASAEGDSQRRYVFGGARWSEWGLSAAPGASRARVGFVVSLEQLLRVGATDRLENRLLFQTHVEF